MNNDNEAQGGGDVLYEHDINLVQTTLGTLIAKPVNSISSTRYWLASRKYYYERPNWPVWIIEENGTLAHSGPLYIYSGDELDHYSVRPILTLKSIISISEQGTREAPWILN